MLGQGLQALLTYWFPQLCDGPGANDPPIFIAYMVPLSLSLAGLLAVAELVGLVPTG